MQDNTVGQKLKWFEPRPSGFYIIFAERNEAGNWSFFEKNPSGQKVSIAEDSALVEKAEIDQYWP